MSIPSVDFHCHLDLYPDPALVARRCGESDTYLLSVTTTPKAWHGTVKLAQGHDRIRTALGLHPQLAHERIGELDLFDALLPETRYVGEVGLDGSPEFKPYWREQTRIFEHVLKSSTHAGGRIITVHSRRSATDVLDTLEKYPDAGIPILHWFSGSKAELLRAIDIGCWFSVGPAMVLGKRGRDLVSVMPQGRILTETDGPFAAIGGQPLRPGEVGQAHAALSSCWNVDAEEAGAIVLASFRRLMSCRVGGPGPNT